MMRSFRHLTIELQMTNLEYLLDCSFNDRFTPINGKNFNPRCLTSIQTIFHSTIRLVCCKYQIVELNIIRQDLSNADLSKLTQQVAKKIFALFISVISLELLLKFFQKHKYFKFVAY